MTRKSILQLVSSLSFVALATSASAHALLQKAVPAVGGVVKASPTELRLSFSEGVEAPFSGVVLQTEAGARVPTGPSKVDPANPAVLIVKVEKALSPGTYKVSWHAVAVDTHHTQGNFMFSVAQ